MLVVFFTAFCWCIATLPTSNTDHRIVGMSWFFHWSGISNFERGPKADFFFFFIFLNKLSTPCITKVGAVSIHLAQSQIRFQWILYYYIFYYSQGCALHQIWFVNNWQESGTWEWREVWCSVNSRLDRCGKVKAFNLPVRLCTDAQLLSWAVGSDLKSKIAVTSNRNKCLL